WKASGPVKGFAISLTLGILASLFTALIVGRNIFEFFVDTGRVKKISMLHLISSQNINFLGKGFLACMCSLALIIAGATSFYVRGEKNFGVDFRGGDLITLSSPQTIDVGQVRAALAPINLADAAIQESNQAGKNYITVRTPLHTELTLTMVGAVLTIAGYSINDTIVVYDRIREGLASGRKGSIEQIMNESINQTLSRTILTSTVTLIPILCLFFFGGAVLRD